MALTSAERAKRWRGKHKEEWNARVKEYRQKHPDVIKAINKRYYERHLKGRGDEKYN